MGNWNDYHDGFRDGLKTAEAVALDLETRWRAAAALRRKEGRRWFFGSYTSVQADKDARNIEAAADGIAAIRRVVLSREPIKEKSA